MGGVRVDPIPTKIFLYVCDNALRQSELKIEWVNQLKRLLLSRTVIPDGRHAVIERLVMIFVELHPMTGFAQLVHKTIAILI